MALGTWIDRMFKQRGFFCWYCLWIDYLYFSDRNSLCGRKIGSKPTWCICSAKITLINRWSKNLGRRKKESKYIKTEWVESDNRWHHWWELPPRSGGITNPRRVKASSQSTVCLRSWIKYTKGSNWNLANNGSSFAHDLQDSKLRKIQTCCLENIST